MPTTSIPTKIKINPFEPFVDKYGRKMKVVFYGERVVATVDEKEERHVMSYQRLINIM